MTSSADREPPQDANPYQSPTHSGWADDPVALLQQLPGGAIELRGSLQPKDVFWGHFDTVCGFTGFAIIQAVMTILAVYMGIANLVVLAMTATNRPVLIWLLLVSFGALWLVILAVIARQWMSAKHLKRLWNERRAIFADQVRRVTAECVLSTSPDEQTETPWTDYAGYRLTGNRLRLHLSRKAMERRRLHRPEGGLLWKVGTRWYDGIDIFPRDQFASREQWQLFVRLVKQKVHRWW